MPEVQNNFIDDYGLKKEEEKEYFLKRIDKFSDSEVYRTKEGQKTIDDLKTDGILDEKDVERLDKNFKEFKKNFSELLEKTNKDEKIELKISELLKKTESFNNDFFELGKMISDLKKYIKEGGGEIEKLKESKEKTEDEKFTELLKVDKENNKKFDEALQKTDIGQILEGWLGAAKIKELIKIPFLGKILKGFLDLGDDFKFSDKAGEAIGDYKINTEGFENVKNLNELKEKLGEIKGVDKLISGIAEIKNEKSEKIVNKTFNNLAKYTNGIENFNSKNVEFSKDKKSAKFQIEASSVQNSIFLRNEINGKDGGGIGEDVDI
ncbi:hypothetical protein LR002_02650, partial [Candidatus Gracilibacteria bacterium]|nr:hypothetical protein [Candidatus Gracilibacteria bacterium]